VRCFELFGSATREDFAPGSDLDFLVEFESGGSLESYLGLRNDLEALFGRAVDLVMPTAIRNPYVRAASIVTGNSSMQREPAAFPWEVREATLRIREFVAGHDFNTYKNSYLVQ
jgi:predicted nucleotidyltransferase